MKAGFRIKSFWGRIKAGRPSKSGFVLLFCILLPLFACVHSSLSKRAFGEPCLASEIQRLDSLPEQQIISTLDNQKIELEDFGRASPLSQPGCILPSKFYHWHNEIKEVSSKAINRTIRHKIRAYYNLTSTCYPEKRHEGQVYGDVAEFYDENVKFMGFAIYLGEGLYCPLPYPGYVNPDSLEAASVDWNLGNKGNINVNERKEG
jgi:hypothetical protein